MGHVDKPTHDSGTPCHHSVKRAEGGHGIKGIGYTNSALGGGGGRIGCKQIKKRTTRNGKAVSTSIASLSELYNPVEQISFARHSGIWIHNA